MDVLTKGVISISGHIRAVVFYYWFLIAIIVFLVVMERYIQPIISLNTLTFRSNNVFYW